MKKDKKTESSNNTGRDNKISSRNKNGGARSNRPKSNRGSKPNNTNRNSSSSDVVVKEDTSKSKDYDINDSTFYYTDNTLKEQLTSYTLTGFLGLRTRMGQYRSDATASATVKECQASFPSIMRIALNPALSTARLNAALGLDATSAGLYKASLKNYVLLSANNAKTTQYQQNDVTMLIIATGQICAMVGFIKRAFGSMFKFNLRNRDLPEELITGMHINYSDFKLNYANYRIRFNTILNSLNRLPLPGNIGYIAKWGSIYSSFYKDEPNNDLAQWYMLVPYSTWKFNEEKSDTGSGFDTVDLYSEKTMSQILSILEDMVNAMVQSATFNYIFADVLRIHDKSGYPILGFELLEEGYLAPELFSDEFNLWIENADITGEPKVNPLTATATPSNDVYSDVTNATIIYNPMFAMRNVDMNCFANFKSNNPSTEEKLAATRLKHTRNWPYNENNEQGIICGDCYVANVDVYHGNPVRSDRGWGQGSLSANGYTISSITPGHLGTFSALTQFNYAPKVLLYNDTDTDAQNASVIGAIDFFTEIPYKVLYEMWDAEWLGLIEMR